MSASTSTNRMAEAYQLAAESRWCTGNTIRSVQTSRFLSLVLRHDPERIGIVLDDAGWTDDVSALLAEANHRAFAATFA